jgi:hypothetical protein
VGIIPAFSIMSPEDNPPNGPLKFSPGQLLLWSTALAFFGVFMAVPLRQQTIIREKLKFPSGTATASVIATLHGATMREEGRLASCAQVRHLCGPEREPSDIMTQEGPTHKVSCRPVAAHTNCLANHPLTHAPICCIACILIQWCIKTRLQASPTAHQATSMT